MELARPHAWATKLSAPVTFLVKMTSLGFAPRWRAIVARAPS